MNIAATHGIVRSESEVLPSLLHIATENHLPIAVWRRPNDPVTYVLLANEYRLVEANETIEELSAGFLFAPFDPSRRPFYLPADFLFKFENGVACDPMTPQEISSVAWLEERLRRRQPTAIATVAQEKERSADTSVDFIQLTEKALQTIQRGDLEKVVPSRTRVVKLPGSFDLVTAFNKLRSAYDHAFVSLVSVPDVGTWMGASPESLFSIENKTIFKTVALAGTLPYKPGMNLKSFAWTQKEIEEQALVERYVISCFKKIRLREYEEHGPRTVVAGNLVHLKSEFSVDMKATNFPQLGSVMLRLLHPTSAVCGMPLEPALRFLKESEGYDREFYAGYLGPTNINGNIDVFVNLRCMKIQGDHAVLFAGAGITADSEPSLELKETEMKFQTLLNVVF